MKPATSNVPVSLTARVMLVLVFVGFMWVIHGIDAFRPSGTSVIGMGIVPRTWYGLKGIPVAPFIHKNWAHLMANTLPLLILGALVVMRGVPEFVFVTGVIAAISGVGTWFLGSAGQHAGASGIVLGFAGFLLFRSAFDHRPSSSIVTLLVALTERRVLFFRSSRKVPFLGLYIFLASLAVSLQLVFAIPNRPKADPRVEAGQRYER